MDDAPMDGTFILLWFRKTGQLVAGYWGPLEPANSEDDYDWLTVTGQLINEIPTAWLPMPWTPKEVA